MVEKVCGYFQSCAKQHDRVALGQTERRPCLNGLFQKTLTSLQRHKDDLRATSIIFSKEGVEPVQAAPETLTRTTGNRAQWTRFVLGVHMSPLSMTEKYGAHFIDVFLSRSSRSKQLIPAG